MLTSQECFQSPNAKSCEPWGQAGLTLSQQKHVFKTVKILLSPRFLGIFLIKWNKFSFFLLGCLGIFIKCDIFIRKGLKNEGGFDWASIFWLNKSRCSSFYIVLISTVPVYPGKLRWDMKKANAAVFCSPFHSPCPIKSQIFSLISGRKGRVCNMAPPRFVSP